MNFLLSSSRITPGDHKLSSARAGAIASWTAAVLCRFHAHRYAKSARGLAQSKTWRPTGTAWQKCGRIIEFIGILTALLVTFGAIAETTNELSDSEIQGRQLAQHLCKLQPTENFTNTGVLNRRDGNGKTSKIAIRFETVVTTTNWSGIYEVSPVEVTTNSSIPKKLVVLHNSSNSNDYRLTLMLNGDPAGQWTKDRSDIVVTLPFAGDFSVADLGLEFFHWPQQKILKHEMRRGRPCKVLESTNPDPDPNGYSRVVSWIDNETLGIVQAEAYDAKGKLLKEFYPKTFKKVNGQWELQEMEIRNDQTGSRTRLEFDLKHPD